LAIEGNYIKLFVRDSRSFASSLDSDVANLIKEACQEQNASFKSVLNETLWEVIRPCAPVAPKEDHPRRV